MGACLPKEVKKEVEFYCKRFDHGALIPTRGRVEAQLI
jgi:hypothetical protein